MASSYRWGILGPGKIARDFAAALNYTGAVIQAVASRDEEKAKEFAATFGAQRYYNNYESLAADKDIDIIYVATPHAFHLAHASLCMQHKKAVLCEKPLSLSYQQSLAMANTASEHDVFLMEGMWTRFIPAVNKVKELIDRDVIGPVQHIAADFGFNLPYDPQSRLYNLQLGGGSLLDVGVYPVFLVTYLLGAPTNIQSVSKLAPSGADEYCNVLLQYAGGQSANIFSAITLQTGVSATVTGAHGRILIHSPWFKSEQLTVQFNNGKTEHISLPLDFNGFEYEIREVNECLARGFRECPAMPLDFSLEMGRIMDVVKEQAGIFY
jgi:predicted dehydrogenase